MTVIPEHFITKILHHLRGECIVRWTRVYVAQYVLYLRYSPLFIH